MRHALLAVALVAPAPLLAQVGHLPAESPYRDLEYRQELSLLTGWFNASKDPAGVAPRSGPLLGVRYDVRVGGPAQFTARLGTVFSERRVLDPSKAPGAGRDLGMREQGLYLADAGLTLNLTGQKSIREFVPVVHFGFGLASDFRGRDVGNYRFGTSFAFTAGGGVRWVPGDRWQLRADIADYVYQVQYPDQYFVPATAGGTDAVLQDSESKSSWRQNVALTIGASYLFFR